MASDASETLHDKAGKKLGLELINIVNPFWKAKENWWWYSLWEWNGDEDYCNQFRILFLWLFPHSDPRIAFPSKQIASHGASCIIPLLCVWDLAKHLLSAFVEFYSDDCYENILGCGMIFGLITPKHNATIGPFTTWNFVLGAYNHERKRSSTDPRNAIIIKLFFNNNFTTQLMVIHSRY